jgi:DNA repair protein RadC
MIKEINGLNQVIAISGKPRVYCFTCAAGVMSDNNLPQLFYLLPLINIQPMRSNLHDITEITISYQPIVKPMQQPKISSSQAAFELCMKVLDPTLLLVKEEAIVVYINRGNRLIGVHRLSIGGLTCTIVDVRLIMALALKCLASGIIMAHTHPSGDLEPSDVDLELTKLVKKAADFHLIKLYEHLIITQDGFYSLNDEGHL